MSRRYQERRQAMLRFVRDRLEQRLAAVNASLEKLEQQIERDEDTRSSKAN